MASSSVDRFDLLALVGLALLNVGLVAIYWPMAPLVTGALVLLAVIYAARRGKETGHGDTNQPGEDQGAAL